MSGHTPSILQVLFEAYSTYITNPAGVYALSVFMLRSFILKPHKLAVARVLKFGIALFLVFFSLVCRLVQWA